MLAPAPRIGWFEASDGTRLATRRWEVADPLAHVVVLHGIVSHGGWYVASGTHLAREGFAVHMPDRRGSGLSGAGRGDVDRWETWPGDVEEYLETLPRSTPRLVLGISWGGTLATAVARRRGDLVDGLGLICPGLFSKKAATRLQRAALHVATGVGLRAMRVTIPLRDPALFTSSPKQQAYVARDPLSLRTMTIRMAAANQRLVRYATERPEAVRCPTLLMLAERDPISDNARLRSFAHRMAHENRRTIEYRGASHTLEFEPDPHDYFNDLATWCRDTTRG